MGMGLPISKTIVEEHSGKIWGASRLGEGTSFFVLLPGAWPQEHDLQVAGNQA
jgi:signal transduction histidine kinase